ncbi:patatin-like phospholipase family protein [Hymenobacter volaticus]|uniref:Patatin-like phospholipase family protein n=1 Tax=Hymenobacter volaticus TaxID=2932254 RepID=A0ABY4GFY4_9BACT|nr:patatin-like phospholipase family protein [Hymenobacter volaticus]UOQ69882.1 patatin-like phospholipase family protein [Hymenobacter volaticus]
MTFVRRFGLALSGGGYRAAAFHLGTLKKLHELGLLSSIEVISTISGGSITGAAYCLHEGNFEEFHAGMTEKLRRYSIISYALRSWVFIRFLLLVLALLVICGFLLFTRWAPLALLLLVGLFYIVLRFQFKLLPISQEIEKAYDAFFYQGRTLQQLPDKPVLAIGSSNLQTGRPFTFSRDSMADSTYTYAQHPVYFDGTHFPIARAVTASSCVPFAFTPISIDLKYFREPADTVYAQPQLIDGGVYDNQGMQKLTQLNSRYECNTIVVSDAGAGLSPLGNRPYFNTIALLLRTVDLFMNRIKNSQMMAHLFQRATDNSKCVAYLSLGWELKNSIPGFINNLAQGNIPPAVIEARQLRPEWVTNPREHRNAITTYLEQQLDYLALEARDLTTKEWQIVCGIGTNLTPLSSIQLSLLNRHAENLTEAQVKLYWPVVL